MVYLDACLQQKAKEVLILAQYAADVLAMLLYQSSSSVQERCAQADAEWLGSVPGFVMCCLVSPVTARFKFIDLLSFSTLYIKNRSQQTQCSILGLMGLLVS